jgi:RNA polymerase sigma factor (sigma-70 family)
MTRISFNDPRRSRAEVLRLVRRGRRTTEAECPPLADDIGNASGPLTFDMLVATHADVLHIVADRQLGADLRAKADASDLVQDTFLDALLDYRRFAGLNEDGCKALLIRMMLNNLRSLAKRYRVSRKREICREISIERFELEHGFGLDFPGRDLSPGESAVTDEDVQRLKAILARLPERDKVAVTWRSRDNRTYREIGEHLGCSAVAARKLCLRSLRKLRREMTTQA